MFWILLYINKYSMNTSSVDLRLGWQGSSKMWNKELAGLPCGLCFPSRHVGIFWAQGGLHQAYIFRVTSDSPVQNGTCKRTKD